MANTIKVKRSAVAGKVPTTTDLELGELAINTYDGKLYLKKDDGTPAIVTVNPVAGTGDVVGPASATDNAITRFDGTTGKLIQNSTVTLDDTGNFSSLNGFTFTTSPTSTPTATGSMFWDSGDGTPAVVLNANTNLQLGQESVAKVYNGTGSTISKGQVVAVSGAQGQRPSVVLADADTEALSAPTLGIAAENIANGAEGFVCTFGLVRGINTSAFTAGNPIYLSSTAGAFTATKPQAPQHIVALGWVIKVNASSGEIFVNINNGWEIDELHNVKITSAASGNTLIYDGTNGYWVNANLTAGTGINVTNAAGSITVTNSLPMTYPGAGIPNSTGSAWGTSYSTTGSGTVVALATSPTLVTPVLGTPTSGTLTNCTGLPLTTGVTGTLPIGNGGTGQTTYTDGQLLIGNSTGNTLTRSTLTAGSGISITNGSGSITIAATNAGTVTSVTATAPVQSTGGTTPVISLASGYGDTLNPYASKTANYVLAAPNGLAGVPTFRALVSADIPTLNQNTTGSAASLSISGQTGLLSFTGLTTTNRIKTVRDAADTLLELGGSYTPTGTWNWTTATVTWPTFNQNTTGTASNVTGTVAITNGGTGQTTKAAAFNALSPVTTLGDIIYGDAANSNTRLAGNITTTRQFLRQTGTGTVSAAPAWDTVTKTDVGLSNVENTALSTWAGSANITTVGTIGTGTWNATTIGVSKGGTGLTSIAALSIPVANTANTYTTVTGTAGQSVRVNAGGTAWEAFTPGTVTSVGGTGTVSGLTLTGTVTSSGNLTLGGNLTIAGDMIYDDFTATAGQTTFTTSTTYTSGKIEVYVNGCKMVNAADVTVTSGTSIVFATGLTVGDRVTAVYPT